MKKTSSLCIGLSLFSVTAFAQHLEGPTSLPGVTLLSPQTYEMVKHGNVPISHFTGQADIKVPIYTYSDADFQIPVFLSYNSSGFIPAKREGIVGLNWFINGGSGVITRKVNGQPDDKTGSPESAQDPTLHGYFYSIKNQLPITTEEKEQVFDPNNGEVAGLADWHRDNCEVEPDDFTFNIPGLTGKFYISHTGEVITSGNKPFRVDLTEFAMQPAGVGAVLSPSKILVTTDDGYSYSFGGSIQHLEVTYPIGSDWVVSQSGYPVIDAWHLTEMKAPNGRTVTYEYVDFQDGDFLTYYQLHDPWHFLLNVYDYVYASVSSSSITKSMGLSRYAAGTSNSSGGVVTIRSLTKTVYLQRISIDNTTSIEFTYSEKGKLFYKETELYYDQKTLKLDAVSIMDSGAEIKGFVFDYDYYGGYHSRLFLTSLRETGLQSSGYNFYYHKIDPNITSLPSSLPDPKTHGIDHWGFWNGDISNGPLLPDIDFDEETADAFYVSTHRQADASKCDIALLSKIVYPTGGYSQFFYEGHDYARRLERRSSHGFLPHLYEVTGHAGGARIKEISDFDGERLINRREYHYKSDYVTNGIESSGILLSWPRYLFYWEYRDDLNPNNTATHTVVKETSSTISSNYFSDESFIHYQEVTEVSEPGNGFVNFKFQSYEAFPDIPYKHLNENNGYENIQSTVNAVTQTHVLPNHLAAFNSCPGQKLNDRSIERGLPSEITTYASKDGGGFYAVKKTHNVYYTYEDYLDDYTVGVQQTGGIAHSYKRYYFPALPKVVTETRYSDEGTKSTSTMTTYSYNATNYLSKNISVTSDGNTKSTEFLYPLDLVNEDDHTFIDSQNAISPLYASFSEELKSIVDLKLSNVVNKPIEVIDFYNGSAVKATYIEYRDFAGLPASKNVYPSKVWKAKIAQPIFSFDKVAINKGTTWQFVKNPAYYPEHDPLPEVTFDKYDDKGNLLQTTDRTLLRKSYLWGYNNMYPIAEIIGVPWNQFFYTGFEEDGTNDINAKAGRKSKPGGYSKTLANLSPGIYILSYWKKQLDNWEYVDDDISVSPDPEGNFLLTIDASIHLDELRFYPKSPLIRLSTYTYDRLAGMTSKMDANNKLEFYEYDSNERLKFVRDDSRNIVRKFEYNYQLR